VLFLGFACYSLVLASDVGGCGCFGEIKVSSSHVIFLDLVVAALSGFMAIWSFESRLSVASFAVSKLAKPILASLGVFTVIVTGELLGGFNQISDAKLTVAKGGLQVNDYVPETGHFSCIIRVYNHSDRDVRIVGIKPRCGTKYMVGMPQNVPKGDFLEVPVVSKMQVGKSKGELVMEYFASVEGELIDDKLIVSVDLGGFAFAVPVVGKVVGVSRF
jgi:hypothetical protein